MIKIIVIGVAGRMGQIILDFISKIQNIDLVAAIEKKGHPSIGLDISQFSKTEEKVIINDDLEAVINQCDIIIDFTNFKSSLEHIALTSQYKKSIIIGSTGFSIKDMKKIKDFCKNIKCVMDSNMSLGINIMFKIFDSIADLLYKEYDLEILEAHHNLKKDAPSGTALKIAKIFSEKIYKKYDKCKLHNIYKRKGIIGPRNKNDIGIQVIRAGDIIGEHTVLCGAIGERLEFTHRAYNRSTFAKGTIIAVEWLFKQKKNGLYNMQNVFGFK